METQYEGECEVCGAELEVTVRNAEEIPEICPLCGSPVEYEEIE